MVLTDAIGDSESKSWIGNDTKKGSCMYKSWVELPMGEISVKKKQGEKVVIDIGASRGQST